MSVSVRISYSTDEELRKILKILSPVLKECKISKQNKGPYKKAYAEIKTQGV